MIAARSSVLDQIADVERSAIQNEPPADEGWPDKYPFDSADLPSFPVADLPVWMRAWVAAESQATQTPVDLPACLALATASLAVSRVFHVQVRPGWREPCNLWVVVALPPGERKSPVYTDATAPVYAFVRYTGDRLASQIAQRARDRRILEAQIKKAEDAAVAGRQIEGEDARKVADARWRELRDLPELHAPVLLTDDCTSEALAVLLSQQDERMGIFSAEGGPFELMAGRYTDKGSNFEIQLKAHPGDPHVVHRISRDPISLQHPLLTMALTVQPAVLSDVATKDGFRGRGLLARFFYCIPQSAMGLRGVDTDPVPADVALAYQTAVASMLVTPAQPQQSVSLSREADRARAAFQLELEPRLGIDGDLRVVADWANKLTGGVCRLAGVLHVADHATGTIPAEVPVETWLRAERIGRYFLAHALHAFELMGADPVVSLAERIWQWAKRTRQTEIAAREAQRAVHAPAEELGPAIAVLLERGLLREAPKPPPAPGRPPSPRYQVRPGH